MQLDINIEGIVAESVAAALSPEKLQPIIDQNVSSAVTSAIKEQFSYNSPFKKLLEASLEGAMPTSIEGLGRYGDLVLKTVSSMIEDYQEQALRQTITEKLEKVLAPLPARIKLSELIDQLAKAFEDSHLRDKYGSEAPTFIVEKGTGYSSTSEYWTLYADANEGVEKYSCQVQMAFTGEGECYSLRIGETDMKKSLILGSAYGAEALVLNLYTGGTKVDYEQIYAGDIRYAGSDDY
ncbi:hypothetical protein PPUJ13061_55540 [Pseudomonas putida]|uniref:hypothetical protein n=1 Tax=Pseudomonas putida TaxID=303 RepID=UPI000E0D46CF|nr:hypothetical protein [Pseudomonas putida]WQE52013.1 hypothetical protein U0028_19280 [Pseudomonas putida]GLO05650.1 hypothetical protein PPUJ13061_55540 [Pseudomonas putida]HDS1009085.1 hypothetical protein [Pseudomonas putida]